MSDAGKKWQRVVDLTEGQAMVVTDLHGDWDAYRRYRDSFFQLRDLGQADILIFAGDMIHASAPAHQDKSVEIVLDIIELKKELGDNLIYLFDWNDRNFSLTNTTVPAVNILETNDSFLVEMAAPGMTKKDFQIELENEMLKIKSEKEVQHNLKEGDRYTRREFSYQSFERSFHLPKSIVDDSKIKAKYEDGMLRIMIPKREEAKALPPRTIAIQ